MAQAKHAARLLDAPVNFIEVSDLNVDEIDRDITGRRAIAAESIVRRGDGYEHLGVERAESTAALTFKKPDHSEPSAVYADVIANRVAILEELLRHVGAQNDDLVPVVNVGKLDKHAACEVKTPGAEVRWCHADNLRRGVLAASGKCCEAADFRRSGKYCRGIDRIDQGVGVAKRKLRVVSVRLYEQEVRTQALDDPGDLLSGAAANRHERNYSSHTDDDTQQRESGSELVGL